MTNPPPRGLLVANLQAQLAFGLFAMTVCLPSMQEWGSIFGAGQPMVQLTFSAYVVAYGCVQLVYGPLSDRLGRKQVLIFGLTLASAGSVFAAFASDLPMLIGARLLQGAGGGAGMVVGRALVQDLFGPADRTRMMAYTGMTMGLVPPLATLIGGQLHVHLGWRASFLLAALTAVLLIVAAWRGLPARPPAKQTVQRHWLSDMLASYARLTREPAFLLYVGILSMTTSTFYVFLAGAPIVLRGYGVGPAAIGYYIMCIPGAYIAGNYLTSRIIQRRGERSVMLAGQVFSLGGLVLMLVLALAGVDTPLALALPLMLLGFGHGLLVPPALAGTVSLLPALAGAAAAVAGVMQQLGGALGGYVVGLFDHEGAVQLGWLMLGLAGCGALAQALLVRLPDRTAR